MTAAKLVAGILAVWMLVNPPQRYPGRTEGLRGFAVFSRPYYSYLVYRYLRDGFVYLKGYSLYLQKKYLHIKETATWRDSSARDKQNQWIAKAEQAYEKGLFEDAAELFSKAAEAEPSSANLWIKLAASQKYTGKYDAAVRSYKKRQRQTRMQGKHGFRTCPAPQDSGKCEEALCSIPRGNP